MSSTGVGARSARLHVHTPKFAERPHRRTLPGGIGKGATDDTNWHELEFRVEGAKLTAVLDGTVRAESYDTFFTGGKVGLWTKSDSQSEFDDFAIEALE